VSAVAVDADGLLSQPAGIRIPGPPQARGTARLIAVGVDEYGDPRIEPLQSAKRDASNMVRALAGAQGRAFAAVQTTSLLDAEVTPKAVLAAVTDAVAATGPDDTLVLFFAGHGVDGKALGQPDAGLVLATHGTRIADLAATSIRWSALAEALAASKGTVVVVLDACHAGIAGSEAFATNDAVVSALLTTSGAPMIVLAGSKGRQFSQETGDEAAAVAVVPAAASSISASSTRR
jgi:uncharacterized caspase-like protein